MVPSGEELLFKERQNSSFSVLRLTHLLDGGQHMTLKREKFREIARKEGMFQQLQHKHFLNREEQFERALELGYRYQVLRRKHGWSVDEFHMFMTEMGESTSTFLHEIAFLPFLRSQGTPQQLEKWLAPAENYEIIGCYAQTELGHGSNVRGLETEARFDKETDEFVLNTPTLTSLKWWPGGLARTATHAIVIAQLIIDNTSYGVHAFLVQLRSLENHLPLPGISLGDIGPKLGMNGTDNGYLRLRNVRIPRDQMFARFAQVDRNGNYSKPQHEKLSYLGMLTVRATIVRLAYSELAIGVTIAVRYSAVRCQFGNSSSGQEEQVLNYTVQQYRVLPWLAAVYSMWQMAIYIEMLYQDLTKGMEGGDLTILPHVHSVSSGLKSLTTTIASTGIEECRKACGGHGYAKSSGLPDLWTSYVSVVTAEGENYLLTQQTARYLLKQFANSKSSSNLPGTLSYLTTSDEAEKCQAKHWKDFLDISIQLEAYKHRASRLIRETFFRLQEKLQEQDGVDSTESQESKQLKIWNEEAVELYRLSNAHCIYEIIQVNADRRESMRNYDVNISNVLVKLSDLFALYHMEKEIGDFLEDGYFTSDHPAMVRTAVRFLLQSIRPDAVPLVDAFDLPDERLSALGRFDGKVYEALYNLTQHDPVNTHSVPKGYYKYLRPLFNKDIDLVSRL